MTVTDEYCATTLIQQFPKQIFKSGHPTQKPVALLEYLIRTYTDEGWTVLDCCMGSGTTAGTVKLDWVTDHWVYTTTIANATGSHGCKFGAITADSSIGAAAKLLLQALIMLPEADTTTADYGEDYFYADNSQAERVLYRGGHWNGPSNAGVFDSNLNDGLARTHDGIGFRCSALDPAELDTVS